MTTLTTAEQVRSIITTVKAVMKEDVAPRCREDAQRIAAETMHEAARVAVEAKITELAQLTHSFRVRGVRFTIRRELPKRRRRRNGR